LGLLRLVCGKRKEGNRVSSERIKEKFSEEKRKAIRPYDSIGGTGPVSMKEADIPIYTIKNKRIIGNEICGSGHGRN